MTRAFRTPEEVFAAYEAPFPDRVAKAGPRCFPLSLPFDPEDAGHFLQESHGRQVAGLILQRITEESARA